MGGRGFSTYTQSLRLLIIRLSPKKTRSWHGLMLFVPVRHVRPAGDGCCVDDSHGIGGDEFATAVIGVAERSGKLRGFVEPEDADEDLARGLVGTNFEDVGAPDGGLGEVVPGDGDDIVHAVVFVFN